MADSALEVAALTLGPFDLVTSAPLGLNLELSGEQVVAASPEAIYNGRRVEQGLRGATWPQALLLIARMCDECSFANTLAFVRAAEAIAGLRVPLRGEYMRFALAELERSSTHVTAAERVLSLAAAPAPELAEIRTLAAELQQINGGRAPGVKLVYGGLLESANPTPAEARQLRAAIEVALRRLSRLAPRLLRNRSLASQLVGFAVVTPEQVRRWDLRGPLARACGVARDVRIEQPDDLLQGDEAEEPLRPQLITQEAGDAWSRLTIWMLEAIESMRLARLALELLPSGPVWTRSVQREAYVGRGLLGFGDRARQRRLAEQRPATDETLFPPGEEALYRVEGPRGETTCVVVAGEEGPQLAHFHTAGYAALPLLSEVLPGLSLDEIPLALASLDVCLPCAEK